MSPDGERKGGNFSLVPAKTPEELLDIEFQEAIAALPVQRGKERPRRLRKIAAGQRKPLRIAGRILSDGLSVRVPPELVIGAIQHCLKRYAKRKQRLPVQDTGEFRPAA